MHYRGLNRRLDEWVAHDRLRPIERARARGRPRGLHELAGLRASYNTMVPPSARARAQPEGDGELDERTLKEHEAATKVKNIASVVLGCWQMDAWYFSPFPNVPVRPRGRRAHAAQPALTRALALPSRGPCRRAAGAPSCICASTAWRTTRSRSG